MRERGEREEKSEGGEREREEGGREGGRRKEEGEERCSRAISKYIGTHWALSVREGGER